MLREWEFKFNNHYVVRYRSGSEYLVITRCAEAAVKEGAARYKDESRKSEQQA